MKRDDLLRHLRQFGCVLLREGGKHSVYVNRAKELAAKADTSVDALFNARLRYLVETFEAAEANGNQNFRMQLDFSQSRIDDTAALAGLGMDSHEDLFLLMAHARLPTPRLPDDQTRRMVSILHQLSL